MLTNKIVKAGMTKKKIYIGKIVGTHGVKGLFKVELYNKDFLNFKFYKNKTFIGCTQINFEKKFTKGKLTICKSDKFNSIEDLASLIGKQFWIDEANLKKNNQNDFFHKDLMGCKVYNNKAEFLGKVVAIHNFGAGDLLELEKNFKYMIRFYDVDKEGIDVENKKIRLSKNYEL
ncbi:MAG: Ribosome maturation factor RimM [Alphaproteobacteria bacterium MarineAlpha9_Bin4]|nr:16S rRNA processing protein RimM [Pelagibacterales bacterium]PPR27063.1 MAG: Ribosome maturation factor RimM [Alphaproteobacteria bacterium MarineAlpha9_Bin4]